MKFKFFRQGNYMKITKCKLKLIQTFVCWVFTKVFIKHGQQRNHILQDLTGLEIQISMKASKTVNWFETTKMRFAKTSINIPRVNEFSKIQSTKCTVANP